MSPVVKTSHRAPAPAAVAPATTSRLDAPDPKALHTLATAVMTVSVLLALAGVIAGLVLVTTTNSVADSTFTTTTTHPYAGLGVALLVAGVVQALVLGMLGQWAKLYAQVVSAGIS